MTNRCGLGNLSFFKAIKERFGLPESPSAVQFCVFGAKGMLLCDRKVKDDGRPEIWLRKSQIKIRYDPDSPVDISHLTVDILRLPRVRTPARLSVKAIIDLHHNGVSVAAFVDALKADLARTIELLLDWGLDVSDSSSRRMLSLHGELSKAARNLQREWKARAESIFDDRSERKDEIQSTYLRGADKVLLTPYADHIELAKKRGDKNLQHDLELIKTHVEKMKRKFEEKYGGGSFIAKHIVARQDALQSVSREFCYQPQLEDIKAITDQRTLARVRASYVYELCKSNTGQQFSWMVAFRELCSIKAEVSSPFRPVVVDFADNFKLTKAATQA
ncbi:hypothetical protein V5O48_010945 [Marasmius crinis-equi]|uniref:RNA-dependent RNA polymerase n=1 Tax=Marasmius crinis-equi TaxID=585013 RepID=A0ABR3F731_9AGAR